MAAVIFDLIDDFRTDPVNPKRDAFEQGADHFWSVALEAADTDGTLPADWLARCMVRSEYADEEIPADAEPLASIDSAAIGGITIVVEPGEAGERVRLYLHTTKEQTQAMPIGKKWVYDVELVRLADNIGRRVVEGRAQVKGEVTR